MTSWATPEQAAVHWPDSTTLDPDRLTELLEAATAACAAYAPPVTTALPPTSYMVATVYQAHELYSASIREGDLIGVGDLAYRSRDLTPTVKQLLRPATRGGVG